MRPPLPDIASRLAKSVVVDEGGAPRLVFRGEHGGDGEPSNVLQTRLASLSFGSIDAANIYALDPNDHRDIPTAPRVIPAYLCIENPFLNDPDDPFVDLARVADALGVSHARRLAEKFGGHIAGTGHWLENINDYFGSGEKRYASPRAFMDAHADRWDELYFDAFRLLDDADEVALLRAAGFDGAVHGGNGETALEAEYRVFDADQVVYALAPDALPVAELREPNSARYWRLNTLAAHAAESATWAGVAVDDEEHARRERAKTEAQELRAREAAVLARYERMRAQRGTESEMAARKDKKVEDPAFIAQRQLVVAEFTQAARELGVLPERAERAGEAIFQSFVVTSKKISAEKDKTLRMLGEKVERKDPERRAVEWLMERSPEVRRGVILNNTRPYVALHMTDEQLGLAAPQKAEARKPAGPFTVTLCHAPNPDLPGGYWADPKDSRGPHQATVATFREASIACREFIERNDLGGGNWAGGEVRDAEGRRVARVSYNGRVWNPDGSEASLEQAEAVAGTMPVWRVTALSDRGPGHSYRFLVQGMNHARSADAPEPFQWSVPSVANENYDLSAVQPMVLTAVVTIARTDTAAFEDVGRESELQNVLVQAGADVRTLGVEQPVTLRDTNGLQVGRLEVAMDQPGENGTRDVSKAQGEARVLIDLGDRHFHGDRAGRLASLLTDVGRQFAAGETTFEVRTPDGRCIGEAALLPRHRLEAQREEERECTP